MKLALLLALAVSANSEQLATGNLLVATAKSNDPDFAHTVVLVIRYDTESAIGLILNKRTDVSITEVLPEAKVRSAVVYAGGPVTIGVRALLRSNSPPFFSVISNKPQLLRMIASGAPSSSFRIYAGYTGWTARQLQSEVTRGLWKVLPADGSTVFDPHPETLWKRLRPHVLGSRYKLGCRRTEARS
jgi:putative transcriptional regulator